jgi:hypothetical protein
MNICTPAVEALRPDQRWQCRQAKEGLPIGKNFAPQPDHDIRRTEALVE